MVQIYFYKTHSSSFISLGSFVEDVVHIYYDSDKTVQEDEEIQAFVKDVCSFGMQDFDYCGEKKLKYCVAMFSNIVL